MSKESFRDYEKRLGNFWNSCGRGYAHIDKKWKKVPDPKTWPQGFGKQFGLSGEDVVKSLKGKVVIDYGIGCGRLGVVLCKIDIKKYIGIDVARRQICEAKTLLSKYECNNYKFYLAPQEFADLNADVFITQACMQHFPSKDYVDNFLANLNRSNVKHLFLQYRFAEPAKFKKDCPGFGCCANVEYLDERLNKYQLGHSSKVVKKNNYQYTRWIRK